MVANRVFKIFIFIFSLVVLASTSLACGSSHAKKSCREKVSTSTSETTNCCKKGIDHSGTFGDCGGKCGDQACNCPSFHFYVIVTPFKEKVNNTFYFSIERHYFSQIKTSLSSGFYSIWSPPNIG